MDLNEFFKEAWEVAKELSDDPKKQGDLVDHFRLYYNHGVRETKKQCFEIASQVSKQAQTISIREMRKHAEQTTPQGQ